jgi:hypothetical protein
MSIRTPRWLATLTTTALATAVVTCSAPAGIQQPPGTGRTLHVDAATGSDDISYAENSAERAWKSIGRAAWGSTDRERRNGAEAARAGDTVIVAAGTYTAAGTNSRNDVLYFTENSGEPGRPITFRAHGDVRLALSSGKGAVLGAYRRNHIVWDGFRIDEADAPSVPDTGPVVVWDCDGCVLENLDVIGNGDDNRRLDNHNGIRIESSRNVVVRNNRVQNVYTGSNPVNGACIMVYASGGVTFEHNELFKCGTGIFLKGGPPRHVGFFTIRYNLLYDIGEDRGGPQGGAIFLHAGAPSTPEAPARIYQNVIRDVTEGIRIWMFDGRDPLNNPMNAQVFNNTIVNAHQGLFVHGDPLPQAGHMFYNNIVAGTADAAMAFEGTPAGLEASRFASNHNLFFRTSDISAAGGTYALGEWRRQYKHDAADPVSKVGDPKFVNADGGDYRLQAGSPARNLGVDRLDLDGDNNRENRISAGAYVTGNETIGRRPKTP